jgi:hypothetical protein
MPMSGRCAHVYPCIRLYAANGDSYRQFSLVVRTGARLPEYFYPAKVAATAQMRSGI